MREDVKLRDVVIGMGACTDSKGRTVCASRITTSPPSPTSIWWPMPLQAAKNKGVAVRVGNIFSADLFYTPDPSMFDVMEKYGILGVSRWKPAGIYGVAAEYGAKALTICTVFRSHPYRRADHLRRASADLQRHDRNRAGLPCCWATDPRLRLHAKRRPGVAVFMSHWGCKPRGLAVPPRLPGLNQESKTMK